MFTVDLSFQLFLSTCIGELLMDGIYIFDEFQIVTLIHQIIRIQKIVNAVSDLPVLGDAFVGSILDFCAGELDSQMNLRVFNTYTFYAIRPMG